MAKPFRVVLVLGTAVVVILIVGVLVDRSGSRNALQKYKAQLRAKGEKLSFAELGFPRPPENEDGLLQLKNAVAQIQSGTFAPGLLTVPRFIAPGRVEVRWQLPEALLTDYNGGTTNWMSWTNFNAQLAGAADQLAEIRSAVEHPMRWFIYDPRSYLRNTPTAPMTQFVPMRTAAQWLYADALGALHAGERDRALKDIHAVVQLTEFGKEDPTLVAQMIRVAISGLGLSLTWETLQNPDCIEPELAAVQHDWERIDLLQALANGFLGERAFGDALFAQVKAQGAGRTFRLLNPPRSSPATLVALQNSAITFAWNLNSAEDEQLLFRFYQGQLEAIRVLQEQKPWPEVERRQKALGAELDRTIGQAEGLRKFQYLFSAMAIPNLTKATQTAVRNETQRRLTIVAIALKRFELRRHRMPANLQELIPEFLPAVLIDPMSGQPLRYRRNADGSFVLYSTGPDGEDDGGDPNPPRPVKQLDFWSGRDAVWPTPAAGPTHAKP